MARRIWLAATAYLIIVIVLVACGNQNGNQAPLDVAGLEATAKEVIQRTKDAIPTETPTPTITQTITLVLPPTEIIPTSTRTPTITYTPTLTPTATPLAMIYMTGDTNCRGGPSNHYDWLGYLLTGETANVVGKAPGLDYWLIENPDGDGTCWVWGGYATLEGNPDVVPLKPIPPTRTPTKTATPTKTPAARLYLAQVITCNGQPTVVVRVYNAGQVPLRSYRILVNGEPGRVNIAKFSSNQFSNDGQECNPSISVLDPYRVGYAIAPFDPTGFTNFAIDIQVCTGPGSRGGCVNEYLEFDIYLLTATPTYTPTPTRTPTFTPTSTRTPTATP